MDRGVGDEKGGWGMGVTGGGGGVTLLPHRTSFLDASSSSWCVALACTTVRCIASSWASRGCVARNVSTPPTDDQCTGMVRFSMICARRQRQRVWVSRSLWHNTQRQRRQQQMCRARDAGRTGLPMHDDSELRYRCTSGLTDVTQNGVRSCRVCVRRNICTATA